MTKKLASILWGLIGAAGIVIFILWQYAAKHPLVTDIIKSLFQVITVLALGQLLSVYVADLSYQRQKTDARAEFQKQILAKLTHAYVNGKRYRRLLRARALTPAYDHSIAEGSTLSRTLYDEYMQSINDFELELEALRAELETTAEGIPSRTEIVSFTTSMIDYLRDLIGEYEKGLAGMDCSVIKLDKKNFDCMMDYLGSAKQNRFKDKFEQPYRQAAAILRTHLLSIGDQV